MLIYCQSRMRWRDSHLLPLFWLIIASTLLECDVSSSTTMSNVGNHWRENEQPCQVSCLRNRKNMWKDNANRKLPGRNPKAIIRVKKDLMRLNLYDLPRALVWLFMRLNGGRGELLKEMIPRHLPASYTRADL